MNFSSSSLFFIFLTLFLNNLLLSPNSSLLIEGTIREFTLNDLKILVSEFPKRTLYFHKIFLKNVLGILGLKAINFASYFFNKAEAK